MTSIIIGIVAGLIVAILFLIWALPTKIRYIERIEVEAPLERVYDAIRFQEQLMAWSAWPSETNSLCEVKGPDGQIGAQTIYANQKGKQFGYQEITELIPNERVSFYLESFVAPFEDEVRLEFILRPISEASTEISLWFDETLKRPAFLIAYFGGILKWVHGMHLKDLQGLKTYVEKQAK
ncbi:MAG: SRPBCC domain-containing protein [Bacteroidota bacterium]